MKHRLLQQFFLSLSLCLLLLQTAAAQSPAIKKADSLFFAKDWENAKVAYTAALGDTSTNAIAWNRLGFANYNLAYYDAALKYYERSLTLNPPAGLKPIAYARIAKIYALKNDKQKTFTALDSAVNNGYLTFKELDTLTDFNSIRDDERFKNIRQKVYAKVYPCMANTHAREFDFWIGEWDVYQTGTMQPVVGHSLIQMISGGCALLENWDSQASTGKSINFIDPVTNKWKQSWSGSYANGNQEFVNGEYKDGAMRFTFETLNAQGQKIIGRFIFYNEKPGQVRQFNETSTDGGKTWTTSYDFTYIRKK